MKSLNESKTKQAAVKIPSTQKNYQDAIQSIDRPTYSHQQSSVCNRHMDGWEGITTVFLPLNY